MKKFYTIIGEKPILKTKYESVDKNLITKCVFPITAHILSVVKKGEKFNVVAIDSFASNDSYENIALLREELREYFGDLFTMKVVNAHFEHEKE